MGTRLPNPGLVKRNRPYRLDEAAKCCGVHRNTVRSWIKQGLPTIDAKRPTIIRGEDLHTFLSQRRRDAKTTCPPGHFYCLKCRAPRLPAEGMAEYVPQTNGAGNLVGFCPDCEGWIYRRASWAQLDEMRGFLDITVRLEE